VRRVVLRLGHQRFDELANGLGFGNGGLDTLVQDERRSHIRHQRFTVSRLTAKVVKILIVSHN